MSLTQHSIGIKNMIIRENPTYNALLTSSRSMENASSLKRIRKHGGVAKKLVFRSLSSSLGQAIFCSQALLKAKFCFMMYLKIGHWHTRMSATPRLSEIYSFQMTGSIF